MRDLCPPPLTETYHEGVVCPPYVVFSLLQKPVNVGVKSRIVSDSEFQIEGPFFPSFFLSLSAHSCKSSIASAVEER